MKIYKTYMMERYLGKLGIRIAIFLSVFLIYLYDKELLLQLAMQPFYEGITYLHIIWAIFMVMMVKHLFPKQPFTMALLKSKKETYLAEDNYSKEELFYYTQDMNLKAWYVMLIWILGNGIVGILYALDILVKADLLMLSVFYFLCDYICILFYCPFQSHIMKNKCCVNCRIYDWGHFMMFTPMLFIKSFYSLSLFFTACIVLVNWEIQYAKHPERYYSGSNKVLQCKHCKDKTCQIKKKITGRRDV